MIQGTSSMAVTERLRKFWEFWYYQYILWTALYMLESWERKMFNSIVIGFILTASYTTYLFLPEHLMMLNRFYHHMMETSSMGTDPAVAEVPLMTS